jgi:hypothetical protein
MAMKWLTLSKKKKTKIYGQSCSDRLNNKEILPSQCQTDYPQNAAEAIGATSPP